MKHGVDVIRHLNAAEGRDLFAALRSYLRETLQEEIQGKDSAPGSGSGKYRSWCIVRSESGIGFGIIIQYRTGNEGIRMDSSRKVLFTPRVL